MGEKFLIDTNAVIEFLGGALPKAGSDLLQNVVDNSAHHLSVINQIELLGFNGASDAMQTIEAFISSSSVLPLSEIVVQKTIELRKGKKIKLPDAIIAATALVHNLVLVTRNTSDFSNIDGLQLVNPHDWYGSVRLAL